MAMIERQIRIEIFAELEEQWARAASRRFCGRRSAQSLCLRDLWRLGRVMRRIQWLGDKSREQCEIRFAEG